MSVPGNRLEHDSLQSRGEVSVAVDVVHGTVSDHWRADGPTAQADREAFMFSIAFPGPVASMPAVTVAHPPR